MSEISKNSPPERGGGERDIGDLLKSSALNALKEEDRYFLTSVQEPSLKTRLTEIAGMRGDEQRSALNSFRIEIGQRQRQLIEIFLQQTKQFNTKEKDFLRRNLNHLVFWRLLLIAALNSQRAKVTTGDKEIYEYPLTVQSIKYFISKYEERQEFTVSPDLDVGALTRFHERVIPAAKRLAQAEHSYQVVNMMAGESLLVELREAVMKLSRVDIIKFLNRLYKDPEFASFKIGIYRLINYLYPPPAKR